MFELSVARLNVCTVLHVKPENLGGQEATKGGRMPPCAPPPPPKCNPESSVLIREGL